MKKYLLKIFMLVAIAVSFTAVADAQLVVKIRPPMPVIQVRPVSPSPRHVWVNGEYTNHGGHYEYNEGYWAEPPRHRHQRTEGHWKNTRHGYVWVPGNWR